MSADNGIYILKTGKQYRVKHLHAIESLYWCEKTKHIEKTMQPDMIITMFGDCKYTYNAETAFQIATSIRRKLPICEYGVVLLDAERSWEDICKSVSKNE